MKRYILLFLLLLCLDLTLLASPKDTPPILNENDSPINFSNHSISPKETSFIDEISLIDIN